MNKFTNKQKINKSLLLPATVVTLILLNIGRAIGGLFFYSTNWYQRILYDDIHHYQIGLVLFPATYVLLRTFPRLRSILLGVATALILDELFLVVEFVGIDPYFHRTFLRWLSFDLAAFMVFVSLYNLLKKRVSSIHEIDEL